VPLESLVGVAADGDELDIESQIGRARLVTSLAAAIKALPERLQTVLGLHYLEGLTYREIAKILDVSEPRVCQLHADGVKKLKVALAETSGG
jgi:RNA polymerase sigma factor for flagellar operon FliA